MTISHELTKQLGAEGYPVANHVGSIYYGSIEVRTLSVIEDFAATYTFQDGRVISGFGKNPFEALISLTEALEGWMTITQRSLCNADYGLRDLKFYMAHRFLPNGQ